MARGREKFEKYKSIINLLVKATYIFPKKIRIKLFDHFRMTQGTKGLVIRYVFLKSVAKECGDNVSIHPNVYIYYVDRLKIGNNVCMHSMCYIDAEGGIDIGNDVSLAHGVSLTAVDHNYSDPNVILKDQGTYTEKITIEDNVWIGAKATVLVGKRIQSGSIVGSHALVTKDVVGNVIVGGVPAKVIKERA